MTDSEQLLVGLVMAAGLIGVLLPVIPGLLLIWAAGLWWTIADGGGSVRWTVFAVLTALLVVGSVTKYLLPARSAAARGRPGDLADRRRRGRWSASSSSRSSAWSSAASPASTWPSTSG